MPVTLKDDKVWFNEVIKLDQLRDEASALQETGYRVLLLSHFQSTLSRLATLLRARGIRHERFASFNPAELCGGAPGKLWLGAAQAFRVAYEMTSTERGTLEIVIAEHHPIQSHDQEVIDAAAKLSCDANLSFYFSLDDPVMRYFGAGSVQALFKRLGIPQNECVSHHLVTNAIRAAQEKIERKVGKDVPTQSVADWFKYNLPKK